MTTAAIVQARLGSTRLPAKVLLPLPTGRTVLEEVLWRCSQIDGVDEIVLAIPDTPENDILARMTLRRQSARGIHLVRGPELDVLARYAKAAAAVNADVIMRITSDCPLIDPQVCGELLKLRERTNAGFASNSWPARSYPVGFDCEAFTRDVLERANADVPSIEPSAISWPMELEEINAALRSRKQAADDREHAGCGWMQRQNDIKQALLKAMDDRSHLRWTLDTKDDYAVIWKEFERQMREAA